MTRLNLIIYGILILIIIYLAKCENKPCPEIGVKDSVSVRIDTVYVDTNKVVSGVFNNPLPIRKHKIELSKNGSASLQFSDTNRIYQDTVRTSEVEIITKDSVNGKLLRQEVSYRLLVPKEIKTTITHTITKTDTIYKPKGGLFIGASVSGSIKNSLYDFRPEVEYVSKKGFAYSYGYGVVTGSHNIGIKKRIF
jgi:hypothetical protein